HRLSGTRRRLSKIVPRQAHRRGTGRTPERELGGRSAGGVPGRLGFESSRRPRDRAGGPGGGSDSRLPAGDSLPLTTPPALGCDPDPGPLVINYQLARASGTRDDEPSVDDSLSRRYRPAASVLQETMRHLFGTDGIRGESGQFPLDPATVERIGVSLAWTLREEERISSPRVVVGRDTRESGEA